MSDTAWDRRQTGWEGAVTVRKPTRDRRDRSHPLVAKAHVSMMQVDYSTLKTGTRGIQSAVPKLLIRIFAAGVIVSGIGVILLFCTLFAKSDQLKLIAAVILAVGSITVVLALLRGQDVDERQG